MHIISFAADYNDLPMLRKLRAREIRDHIRYKDDTRRKHIFVFPYISQLLDRLIENNSPFLENALEKAIQHNESTGKKLKELLQESIHNGCYYGDNWKKEVRFHKKGNIIHFRDTLAVTGIITNIARVTKKSTDSQISRLIEVLNRSYHSIRHITEEEIL